MKRMTTSLFFVGFFCFSFTFFPSPASSNVNAVAGGESHSVALKEDGTVWAWGQNAGGQLGDGTNKSASAPVQVIDPQDPTGYLTGVTAISCGREYFLASGGHTLALKSDGTVRAWGFNWNGQLGDGTVTPRAAAVQVVDPKDSTGKLTEIKAIAAGYYHGLAVRNNGTVVAWGDNYNGQLGDGTLESKLTPVLVSGLTNVVSVAAGYGHSVALKQDGTVWAWGNGGSGQLGDGYYWTRTSPVQVVDPSDPSGKLTGVTAIAAGVYFTVALKGDQTVRAWGYNIDGQLGDGASWGDNKATLVQVVDPSDPTGKLTGVKSIAAGDNFCMVLRQDGTVRTWGFNGHGQLGDGTTTSRNTPVQVTGLSTVAAIGGGTHHALAVKQNGSVWTWGGNWAGQLGDGTTQERWTPVPVTFPVVTEKQLLAIRGPYFVDTGEEATYVVQYENIFSKTLEDTVLIFYPPAGFEYVSSTKDGIYRDDRGHVFWKLGNLKVGDTGYVSVKAIVPWGLPAHTKMSLFAEIGARNITSTVNVDDYMKYVPVEITSDKALTAGEIDALLASDGKLKSLLDYALSLGYVFPKAAWRVTLSDGSSPVVLVLFDPKEPGPIFLKKAGDTAFIEKYGSTSYSLGDGKGGISLNLDSDQLKASGAWAETQSQSGIRFNLDNQMRASATLDEARKVAVSFCILNCIEETVPGWYLYMRDTYKYKGVNLECKLCQESLSDGFGVDEEKCAACARIYKDARRQGNPLKYSLPVASCIASCDKEPNKWGCVKDEEMKRCETIRSLGTDPLMGLPVTTYSFGVKTYRCEVTSYGSRMKSYQEKPCASGETCEEIGLLGVITAQCVTPCKTTSPSGCGTTEEDRQWGSASSCDPCLVSDENEVLKGRDPNAKAVDFTGNVMPGQKLTYTIDYENVGEGAAYGVFIVDDLDPNLDENTLVINNNGSYSKASRSLGWDLGTLAPKGKGSVTYSVKVKSDLPSGTAITNIAEVNFPSVPEVTPTNPVVSVIKAIAADPKTLETTSDKATPITLSGRDTGSNELTYRITQPPAYGTLTGTPPNVTYTSMEDFSGMDEFYYVVNNGLIDSDPARVLLKINPSPADTNPPTVVSTYPKVSATDVHVEPNPISTNPNVYRPSIWATFSEPIDAATVTTSTFTVNGGITGTVTYDERTWTASFIPSKAFVPSTTYTVKLAKGIKDKAGNEMAGEYSWRFTTESPANIVVTLPDNAAELNYGEVLVNQVSVDKVVSVQNTGTLDLVLGTVIKTGTNAGDFKITDDRCSGKTLAQSDNCTARVAFQPVSLGSKSASLSIPSNDPDTPTADAALKGKGVGLPDIKVDPREVNYGKVLKGGSLDWTITVRNDGDGSLVLTGIGTPAAPFSIAGGGTCATSKPLSAGGSCTIIVRFSPTTQGAVSSGFDISSNDPDEGKVSIQLCGQGALFVVSPTEGTIGTVLAITGTGFGGKKGKVGVGGTALKLTDWSNTTIHGSLGKALSPDVGYDVVVTPGEPRGAKPIMETEAFTVRRPDITAGTYHGSPNATVTVTGKYFGTTKGKVYLGTTSCKVVSWTMNTSTGESTVGFVVPTKLAKGLYDLKITNAVGSGIAQFTVD